MPNLVTHPFSIEIPNLFKHLFKTKKITTPLQTPPFLSLSHGLFFLVVFYPSLLSPLLDFQDHWSKKTPMLLHIRLPLVQTNRWSDAKHRILRGYHQKKQESWPQWVQVPLESHSKLGHWRRNLRPKNGLHKPRRKPHTRILNLRNGWVLLRHYH